MPGTVDHEVDRLRAIFHVATLVWGYPLAMNPMDAVRRPNDFTERIRRISAHEERRLLEALAKLSEEAARGTATSRQSPNEASVSPARASRIRRSINLYRVTPRRIHLSIASSGWRRP